MLNRVLIAVAAIIVVGLVVFAVLAWRPGIAVVETPSGEGFSEDQIALGEQMALAGNCETCHTVSGGEPYAGGLPVESDFGTIYATNITPDPETGIGGWSEEAFARAMRYGVRRDGAHLFPAFPYDHFTNLTDEDITAIYAYLMTVAPVVQEDLPADLPFPLNWRALQGGWKLLFFHNAGALEPEDDMSAAWNRGRYLGEGIGHCSSCHTPRNFLGAEQGGSAKYSGAEVGGFYAPAINEDPTSTVPWTEADLYPFLRTGASPLHGIAAGEMSEVIHMGLRALPDEDLQALAVYYGDIAGGNEGDYTVPSLLRREGDGGDLTAQETRGGQVFAAYCVSCHFTPENAPQARRPALSVNSAVVGPDASNFIHVVLNGVSVEEGNPDTAMPAFRRVMTDQDVADVAAYLRARYAESREGDWGDVAAESADIRANTVEGQDLPPS